MQYVVVALVDQDDLDIGVPQRTVVQGLASRNTRTLNAMGFYDDFCVKFDARWLIKEKRIYRCDDETPLPW